MRRFAPVLMLLLYACGGGSGSSPPIVGPPPPPSPVGDPVGEFTASLQGLSLEGFYAESFRGLMRRSPETVVELALGPAYATDDALLDDLSDRYQRDTYAMYRAARDLLATYDRDSLDPAAQLDYDVYAWYLEDVAAGLEFIYYGFPATFNIFGVPRSTELFFVDLHPLESAADAEDYIERLGQVARKFSQLETHLLNQRSQAGVVEPGLTLQIAANELATLANVAASSHPYYTAFAQRLASAPGLSDAERADLRARALAAVNSSVLPAYRSLQAQLQALRAVAPSRIGVGQYPDGAAYYAYRLRHHTTTDLSPAEIHQLGLDELARIHAEMRARFDQLGYPQQESLQQLYARVASDGGFVPAADVLPAYENLVAFAESGLAPAFDLFPSAPVIVRPDPFGGFYVPPTLDGSRPGAFYAGTDFAEAWYRMPSLAYHEAVPGHHTQIAIALEQDVPDFRKVVRTTGFVEGWALYAERLAFELGWYDNDVYADLGRLQYEALRAARLVIDTGIHALGWSFDQAVAFNQANVGATAGASQTAVARYSVLPGQATAYMVGMLAILAERERAMNALGAQFSLTGFHRALLENGSVPLALLPTVVDRYIAAAAP